MAVAERYATPRSIVLGRPLPKPGTPLWLPDDLEWALAYEQHKAGHCGGCGVNRAALEDDPEAFVAVSDRCPYCYELALKDKEIQSHGDDALAARAVLMRTDAHYWHQEFGEAAERLGATRALPVEG